MDKLKQGLTGCRLPEYMEEILSRNCCSVFLRMGIVREDDIYRFSYKPGHMNRMDYLKLSPYEKLLLIRAVIGLKENADRYLIRGDTYLLEPELIYWDGKGISANHIRIMFYPDMKRLKAEMKIILFAERIRRNEDREERELFEQFRIAAEGCDLNRIKLFLDKNIVRYENRCLNRAV